MEVKLSGLQEAVLEVVEVKQYGVLVKGRLRVAVREVEVASTTQLDIGQLANGTAQQLLLLQRIAATSLTATPDGVEQRYRTQISLQITAFVVADSKDLRHWQLKVGKVTAQVDEGMVLVTAGSYTSHHADAIGISQTVVLPVASSTCQLLYLLGLCPTPLGIKIYQFLHYLVFIECPSADSVSSLQR